jgi:hypothetical protein
VDVQKSPFSRGDVQESPFWGVSSPTLGSRVPPSPPASPLGDVSPWNTGKTYPNLYRCTTSSISVPRNLCPVECCTTCTVWPSSKKNTQKNYLDFYVKELSKKSCPPCCMECTDLYSTSQHRKNRTTHTQKICFGICALLFWGNVPTKLLTILSQVLSENLSQSPLNVSHTTQCILL